MLLLIKVKPNAKSSSLVQQHDGSWLATLKAPPADGKANAELIALVAQQLGVPRNTVSIKTGAATRLKRVVVE